MNKYLLFIIVLFFSEICFATSSMSGISKNGYFDYDKTLDKIQCENSITTSYICLIKTLEYSKTIKINDNKGCGELSISDNPKEKGEIIIQCGRWGVNNTYFYKYDKNKHDWFIYKHIYEKSPVNPNDNGYYTEYDIFTRKWTLNDDFKDINNDLPKLLSLKDIELILSSNPSDSLFDLNYLERIFMKYELSNKNVAQYNNISYYLEQRGKYRESIFLLEKIIEKYPSRTVAYINLGDAYWELKEKDKAINAYLIYIQQMKDKGKEKRIPKKIFDRVASSTSETEH